MPNQIPNKLPQYLRRLQVSYERKGQTGLSDLIASSRYFLRENTAHDNWNGGMTGHDLVFYLPLDEIVKIDIDAQSTLASDICEKLGKLNTIEGEYFNTVLFELADDADWECQGATPYAAVPPVNPDLLPFWKAGHARVFISHRDKHKAAARELGEALESYGMSCFVAHDTIQPMKEWRSEILKGLQTMEVMLLYLTDDFEESLWCEQEVGYALGKGVPIVSLKLGKNDPPGFISHLQALRGQAGEEYRSAKGLFPLISSALGRQERLNEVLILSFLASPDFMETKMRFDRMDSAVQRLTDTQLDHIIRGFRANDQLYRAGHLTSKYERLKRFLERTTEKEFTIEGREIRQIVSDDDLSDDVPF